MDDALDLQLANITKKLDEHGDILKSLQTTLATIAVQREQILHIQAVQVELRGDINAMENKIDTIKLWQASCPREHVTKLWAFIIGIAGIYGSIMIYHILGVPK